VLLDELSPRLLLDVVELLLELVLVVVLLELDELSPADVLLLVVLELSLTLELLSSFT
jgi:hypothetical protein